MECNMHVYHAKNVKTIISLLTFSYAWIVFLLLLLHSYYVLNQLGTVGYAQKPESVQGFQPQPRSLSKIFESETGQILKRAEIKPTPLWLDLQATQPSVTLIANLCYIVKNMLKME